MSAATKRAPRPVSFSVAPTEERLIADIVRRYVKMRRALGVITNQLDRQEIEMDLTACHANGCRLRLADLLRATDFNFSHDVGGIRKFINRTTGQIEDNFRPRYAVPEGE